MSMAPAPSVGLSIHDTPPRFHQDARFKDSVRHLVPDMRHECILIAAVGRASCLEVHLEGHCDRPPYHQ